MSKNAVIFGAGSIGRGFIGELMTMSGFEITLIDVNPLLIEKLTDSGHYTLELIGHSNKEIKQIPVKSIINGNDTQMVLGALMNADLVFTAVGQSALKYIAKPIAALLAQRKTPINIILCENMMDAHIVFGDMVKVQLLGKENIKKAGFLRASVGRMVPLPKPDADILVVRAEPYYHLPIDADFIVGELPDFVGLEKVSPFDYAIDKKLFIHNLGHAACAWLGYKKQYTFIYEAVSDGEIRPIVQDAMLQAAGALSQKYGVDISELLKHINDLLIRFENVSLGDTISRVGRDTKRKLSPNDRVVGVYRLCRSLNLPYSAIMKVIKAGLEFQNDDEGTISLQQQIARVGIDKVLNDIMQMNGNL